MKKNIKISIILGVFGFLEPLRNISWIEEIRVFRDKFDINDSKITYYYPQFLKPSILKNFNKLISALINSSKNIEVIIGIYDIPHGLIAFLVSQMRNKLFVFSMISNPGYSKKRHGLWAKTLYLMLQKADAITVTGNNSKQILIKNGIEPKKIFCLPNSIDIKLFKPINVKKKYDLIYLGRISEEKELLNLIQITKILISIFPSIRVGIAGNGEQKNILEKKVIAEKLTKNIIILGFVKDSVEFYNQGRIFVLTSHTEGVARSAVEAMACGIPCVSSNVGDMNDLVINNKTGYVIEPFDNLEKYVAKIELLLKDPDLYKTLSEASINFVQKNFSYKSATNVWCDVFKSVNIVEK